MAWVAAALLLAAAVAPSQGARVLLDLQDLHPVEPGTMPDAAAMAGTEAAFAADAQGYAEMTAASTSADVAMDASAALNSAAAMEASGAAEVPVEEAAAAEVPVEAAAAAEVPVEDVAAAVPAEGGGGTYGDDEYDCGWEDWDQPDADTWFYDGAEGGAYEADYTGWTWDDPIDMEGDHAWDEEWVPERDDSFNGMMDATWTALDTHVAPSISQQTTYSKAVVRAGVSQVLNIEDHPRNYLLLEVLTVLPLLPPLMLVAFLMRAASQTLTMHHLVQFACLFCAGYSGLLIVAAQLTGDDPLAAFQFMAGHGAYIKYQFLVAAAYSLFLMLLYINVCVQRCGSGALIQQILGTSVGLHYYLSTFHPAMIALAPEPVLGLPTGMTTYFMQLSVFFVMAVVPPRSKETVEDEEDDKTLGAGKGQD